MSNKQKYQIFGFKPKPKLKDTVPVQPQTKIEENPINSNIHSVLDRGDNIIQRAHKQAYVIVGLTRKGKSTTFNWMLRRHLKGYTKKEGQVPYYINDVQGDKESAVVGNTYSSVTLAPNVYVDFEKDTSLIDTAGYEDKRDYVGVIGVSYFLKEVFERVRKVKFVIVITEAMFQGTSGQELIHTFQGFISMFEYESMNQDVRAKLRQSIVLVITKSNKHYEHYKKLEIFIEKLMDQEFIVENKEPILELLSWLYTKLSRMQPFRAAVNNRPAQSCTFVERLNKNEEDPWQFFDLDEAESIMQMPVIAFPFKKDFQKMKNSQPEQVHFFQAMIESRIKSYEGFISVTNEFINLFFKNWDDFVQAQKNGDSKIKDLEFYKRMNSAFQKVKNYVDQNNFYEQNILKNFTFRNSIGQISFIQSLTTLLQIFGKVQELTARTEGDFIDHMKKFNIDFINIIDCYRCFATNMQQQKLLHQLQYIIKRGLKDFSRLFQLKKDCIVDANSKLSDYFIIHGYFQPKVKREFQDKIVKNMSKELLEKMFNTLAKLDEYQAFFIRYHNNYDDLDQIFIKQQLQKIESHKAALYLKIDKKVDAMRCYIRIYTCFDQTSAIIDSLNFQSEDKKNDKLNLYSMKKIKTVRKIVEILKVLPQTGYFMPLNEALQLCMTHKMIEDVSDLYDLMINNSNTPLNVRLNYFLDYANHCATWGQLEKAIALLMKRLKLQEQDYNSQMETIQYLRKFNNQRMIYYRQFGQNLNVFTRLPIQDATIRYMFGELDMKIM